MLEAEKYEQSSPSSVSDLIDSENCGIDAIQKSSNIKGSVGCSSSIIPDEVSSRFIPIGSFLSSILEPIPQGQELAVGAMTTSTVYIHSSLHSIHNNYLLDESKFTVQNCHSSSDHHTTTQLKNEVCCPCRLANSRVTQQRNYPQDTGHTCNATTSVTTNITETTTKQITSSNHPLNVHGHGDNHTNNRNSVSSRSSWARSIFERLRASSLTSSTNESKAHHSSNGQNEFLSRFKEHNSNHSHSVNISSDVIDPRRLPKAHGPVSNCLEFSKRPLQKSNNYLHSKSIPVSSTHGDLMSPSLSNSLQPSNTNNNHIKHRRRIRWFSHSTSCDTGPGDPTLNENHVYTTLFRHSTCYDVLPGSGKLVILDSRLPTLRAICALLDNGVMAAPVWCSETQSYMGVFSQELALDMIGHLHYTEVIKSSDSDIQTLSSGSVTDTSTATNSSSSGFFASFNANLYGWGTKQLGKVFTINMFVVDSLLDFMYSRPDRQLFSDLFVYPHYCLQKALYRLFHHNHYPEQHRPYHQSQHPHHQDSLSHHDTLFKSKFSNTRDHRSSYPNNSTKMPMDDNPNYKFNRQSPSVLPGQSSHSSSRLSFSEDNGSVTLPYSPLLSSRSPGYQIFNSNKSDDAISGVISEDFERVSSKCCPLSNPTSLYTSLVPYLIVIDDRSGNALGLLCADRLLAYLRLRVDELPNTGRMNVPIGSVHGLRWAERHTSKKPTDTKVSSTHSLSSQQTTAECLQFREIPVLHPNDRVRDALHVLTNWLPQLPCLPVVHYLDDNQSQSIDQISFISPGDLLHCPYQQQCVCFVTETVDIVLDRMFRLKTPCLIMFDTRKNSASCAVASKPFGRPVGMVTAKDVLHTVILGHRHHPSSLHPHPTHHIDESLNTSQNISGDDYIPYRSKIRDNYKRTVSFESGVLSSSCQDGSENIFDAPDGQVKLEHSEEKFSRSASFGSLPSSGTFSVSSSNSEVMHSLSNERFTSTCTDTVTRRDHCNCTCHHKPSSILDNHQQSHHSKDTQSPVNPSVGFLDKIHNRSLHGSGQEWCADRRSSVPYTTKANMRGDLNVPENKRKSIPEVNSNRSKQLTVPNAYIQNNNDLNSSLQLIDNSFDGINESNVGDISLQLNNNNNLKNKLDKLVTQEEDDTVFPMD
ncbi:AMP-activated protein kinase, gamma regulatory subunit, putative [Schistosoma mansoni]|uniref:AMP-activated protein kinase, gamma regulatory subunit, putative n=1 Tax=Schistosoma mansoni TaxID=6183 RepID=UPI0001A6390C|nr:AMP-activated protein kinase, gamma regulatory subunit, putative [Schistosoma mansoni]|eukprot:XP_018645739.1 AMP-activated protein kinase, gamma regulatory subunit, putative [Schistosoma mansoni]